MTSREGGLLNRAAGAVSVIAMYASAAVLAIGWLTWVRSGAVPRAPARMTAVAPARNASPGEAPAGSPAGVPNKSQGAPAGAHPGKAHAAPGLRGDPGLRSNLALVIDAERGETIFAKRPDQVAPIASITKLMTAMVVLDADLPPDDLITIDRVDMDTVKWSESHLPVKARLTRGDLIDVALMASENRAASALARSYPGGTPACVEAMNRKAAELGLASTRFADPTGLSPMNVSNATDLARLVLAARGYPRIRQATTTATKSVRLASGRVLQFHNTNRLVGRKTWDIALSKTGYIDEAGRCLVMVTRLAARDVVIVLLDSFGKYTRLGDASRIRTWMERSPFQGSGEAASAVSGTAAINRGPS
jgi:D-alanyl-D-alanine endopeptidase (penicillin-binding protein 7)